MLNPVNINSNPNLNNRYDLVDDATRRYNNIANEKSSDKIENSSNLSARSDIMFSYGCCCNSNRTVIRIFWCSRWKKKRKRY